MSVPALLPEVVKHKEVQQCRNIQLHLPWSIKTALLQISVNHSLKHHQLDLTVAQSNGSMIQNC